MTTISRTKCKHCGGGIEFDADQRGEVVECPHCAEHIALGGHAVRLVPRAPWWSYLAVLVEVMLAVGFGACLLDAISWAAVDYDDITEHVQIMALGNVLATIACLFSFMALDLLRRIALSSAR